VAGAGGALSCRSMALAGLLSRQAAGREDGATLPKDAAPYLRVILVALAVCGYALALSSACCALGDVWQSCSGRC